MAAALLFPACGGDGEPAAPQTIEIVARDFAFEPDRVVVDAGRVRVRVTNEGTVHHHWELAGVAGTLSHADPQAAHPVFTLDPGTYRMVCTIPGHARRGMTGTLVAR